MDQKLRTETLCIQAGYSPKNGEPRQLPPGQPFSKCQAGQRHNDHRAAIALQGRYPDAYLSVCLIQEDPMDPHNKTGQHQKQKIPFVPEKPQLIPPEKKESSQRNRPDQRSQQHDLLTAQRDTAGDYTVGAKQ